MQKLKVIHIHTDNKFLTDSNFFECDFFNNQIIILQSKENLISEFDKKIIVFNKATTCIDDVLTICRESDLIVLYDLDPIKIRIALALPSSIQIAWRFFGHELYGKMQHKLLSNKTIKSQGGWLYYKVKLLLLQSSHILKYIKPKIEKENNLLQKAINRINFFLCYSTEEYIFLQSKFPKLPYFIQLPLTPIRSDYVYGKGDVTKVVVGHSRSYYNNHLDILDIIKRKPVCVNHKYILLFNYGSVNSYTRKIKKLAYKIPNMEVIENFLSREKFDFFYDDVSAFVSNSYRQIALGNIFMCLVKGVKVYLNRKNIVYTWLINEGFLVYTINDFSSDIASNKLYLIEADMEHNLKTFAMFSNKYSLPKFQKTVFEHFKNRTNL